MSLEESFTLSSVISYLLPITFWNSSPSSLGILVHSVRQLWLVEEEEELSGPFACKLSGIFEVIMNSVPSGLGLFSAEAVKVVLGL